MNVDYTGRQFDITPKIRKEVEAGLAKLVKIVGENCSSKVILTAEKQRRIAEITVTRRTRKLVGHGEATDVMVAIERGSGAHRKTGAEAEYAKARRETSGETGLEARGSGGGIADSDRGCGSDGGSRGGA